MNADTIIKELDKLLDSLENAFDLCNQGLLKSKEAQDLITETQDKLNNILPPNSIAYRIFDRSRKRNLWWDVPNSGYLELKSCNNITIWIENIQKIIDQIQPEFLSINRGEKDSYFLPEGDLYRPKKILYKLMKRAKKELAIVDEYLDDEVFDYINSLDSSVDVLLITGDHKPIFRNLYYALKSNRSNITAKKYNFCHDRFLVIDGLEIWHLGASINGFGKKASRINKVKDHEEKNEILLKYEEWWTKGNNI